MSLSPPSIASTPVNAMATTCREPENVTLFQGRSEWRRKSTRGPPSASTSDSSLSHGLRPATPRPRRVSSIVRSAAGSTSMRVLLIVSHEFLDPRRGPRARDAAVAQVGHEARVLRGQSPELCPGHVGPAQEAFDLTQEHRY